VPRKLGIVNSGAQPFLQDNHIQIQFNYQTTTSAPDAMPLLVLPQAQLNQRRMREIQIKVLQVWADCDPRRTNRFLLIDAIGEEHVHCHTLRTGRKTTIRTDRLKPTRWGYSFAVDTAVLPEVQKQLAEGQKRQPARLSGHSPTTAKANIFQEQRVNGMKPGRSKAPGRKAGRTVTVNEIELLLDRDDKWKQINSYCEELSTYMFGGIPGFTNRL
jgi:hypothetical protein